MSNKDFESPEEEVTQFHYPAGKFLSLIHIS